MNTLDDLKSGRLKNASRLSLRGLNGQFPEEIFELAETLEVLDLNNNGLSDLPSDFARLKRLKILFLSDNDFDVLPEALGNCKNLTMIGFKANKIRHVPENAVPPNTRWLILTDNQIEALPESMGRLKKLQKCMLAGNQLRALPHSMSQCHALELLRISANQFEAFPEFLFTLPRLSWLAFAGNPFHPEFERRSGMPELAESDLKTGSLLGEGASGHISEGQWIKAPDGLDGNARFAFKAYKGAVTSDGYPASEMAAALCAGEHPSLVQLIARTAPDAEAHGLAMRLIPDAYDNLGLPPDFDTCTRDRFADGASLSTSSAIKIARQIASAMRHLRSKNICHGDLYAHNILVTETGDTLLTDFGAASNYEALPATLATRLERVEVRAFGCLLDDLLKLIVSDERMGPRALLLERLRDRCLSERYEDRPFFAEIFGTLTGA